MGLGYYKKWLASTKISVLSLASNSTINSELARGEWQAMKCSKWEISAVWLSQRGQGFVPKLGLVRCSIEIEGHLCLVGHDLGPYPITWARLFGWRLLLLGLCSGAWLLL